MDTSFFRKFILAVSLTLSGAAPAFDARTWVTAEGQLIEATLVKAAGDAVEVKGKDGRATRLSRAALGPADMEYLDVNAPQEKKAIGAAGAAKIPNPAKAAKVDRTQFKRAGELKITGEALQVYETPHFKILYKAPAEPADLAELAERLWIDAAFFYGGFREKCVGRKIAIIMFNEENTLREYITWSRENTQAGTYDRSGPEGTAGYIQIPESVDPGLLTYVRLIPGCAGRSQQPLKGVWRSSWVNMLATDMLRILTGTGTREATEGRLAMTTGMAYHKEILLTGHAETTMLAFDAGGKNLTPVRNFTEKSWAGEMRSLIKKKSSGWVPNLEELFKTREDAVQVKGTAFAWAFAKYQQTTPARLLAFSKICQKTDELQAVPDLQEIAKIHGFASAEEMQKSWIAWMESPEFR